jgi:glucose-1-phosphate thymidylyltransferase
VKALLLAAGYATRLRPLTEQIAKPLLPGGPADVDWILDRIEESQRDRRRPSGHERGLCPGLRTVGRRPRRNVHDDGTTSNETRLGALGDIRVAVGEAGSAPAVSRDRRRQSLRALAPGSTSRSGAARVQSARSPPACRPEPRAPLRRRRARRRPTAWSGWRRAGASARRPLSTATYLFSQEDLGLLDRYLDEGNLPDPPGRFLIWLAEQGRVFGFRFSESWLDIGTPEQLLEADNRYRERAGLPRRESYSL